MTGDLFWQGDENFVDDGIQIEPFNLNQEREEGYFDSEGNFVEYVNEKEIKVHNIVSLYSIFNYRIKTIYDNILGQVKSFL